MPKNSTITSGLGLNEDFIEYLIEIVENNWKKSESVSDLILASASEIKFDEFEVSDTSLSTYEKKLILLGLVIGEEKKSRDIKSEQISIILDLFKRFGDKDSNQNSI